MQVSVRLQSGFRVRIKVWVKPMLPMPPKLLQVLLNLLAGPFRVMSFV